MTHDLGGFDHPLGDLVTTRTGVDETRGSAFANGSGKIGGCGLPWIVEDHRGRLTHISGGLELGGSARECGSVMVTRHLRQHAQADEEGHPLCGPQPQRSVERLGIDYVDAAVVIPELNVDELVGPVTRQAAADGQPQILLELLGSDAEVLGRLGDGYPRMLLEPRHKGEQAGEASRRSFTHVDPHGVPRLRSTPHAAPRQHLADPRSCRPPRARQRRECRRRCNRPPTSRR